jgi:HPt (histidine-containing phosphotransfer) domain-containing protein
MVMPAESMAIDPRQHALSPEFNRSVDLVHLARYTLGNRSLEREVLVLFHAQCEINLRRLKEAMDDKAWADAAHTIKGSARGIGAWPIAKSAETAEALKGAARKNGCSDALKELETLTSEAKGYIESLLVETEPVA